MKQPWLKFFPSDWRADPMLRVCSLAARGLWIEMLCLMHEARPHGSLLVNARPVSAAQLANLVGATPAEVEGYLAELEEAGVFSRDDDGALDSRRMRRDAAKARADRDNGKAGGNPALKARVKTVVNGGDKAQKPEARIDKPAQAGGAARDPSLRAERSNPGAARDSWIAASASPPRNDGGGESGPGDAACGARLDAVEAACRAALGAAAPVDPVIGPMLPVVEKFGERRVALELASQARRKRSRPIKSWRLWARIVEEQLADANVNAFGTNRELEEAPDLVTLLNGQAAPRAALLAAIENGNAGGEWPLNLAARRAVMAARCRKNSWRCAWRRSNNGRSLLLPPAGEGGPCEARVG